MEIRVSHDPVDQLAGTSSSGAALGRDVVYPAAREAADDGHGLKVGQGQVELALQSGIDRVLQFDLEADDLVEQLPEV